MFIMVMMYLANASTIILEKQNRVPNIPSFFTYKQWSDHIRSVDIGNVKNIYPIFTERLSEEEKSERMFWYILQFAPRSAQFYLTVDDKREDKLLNFHCKENRNKNSILYLMAVDGGDEAPSSGKTCYLF